MSSLGWLAQPAALPWIALLFGLCVGSFLNVVIHRLPRMMEREWRAECAALDGREVVEEEKEKRDEAVGRKAKIAEALDRLKDAD